MVGWYVTAADLNKLADHVVRADAQFLALPSDPVRAARHLVETSLLQFVERRKLLAPVRLALRDLEAPAVRIVEPVAVQHRLRALRVEIGMLPAVVAPGPGPHAVLLACPDKMNEIVHPELVATLDHMHVARNAALQGGSLLVATDVQEPGMAENLCDIGNQVLAHAVVLRSGDHAAVLL